jgi:hypothetical protein
MRKLTRLDNVLQSIPEPKIPRVRLEETVRAVSKKICGKRNQVTAIHRSTGVWAAVAAIIVVAAGIGFLAGQHYATPQEKVPVLESPERPFQRTAIAPVEQGKDKKAPAAAEEVSRGHSDLLVDKLVQAELALSEMNKPGDKAAIYCAMSRDVLLELEAATRRSDVEETCTLTHGYTRLIRDGVLPNVMLASEDEDLKKVPNVIDSLEGNCDVLTLLVAGINGQERALLTEALSASKECLSASQRKLRSE